MRFLAFSLMLVLLLSGCTGSEDNAQPLDADDDAGPDGTAGAGGTDGGADSDEGGDEGGGGPAPDAAPPVIQEETVSWLAPASNGCTDPERVPDVAPGITYGHVGVDEATWGKPYKAAFDVDLGIHIQMTFFAADGTYLDGSGELTASGMVLEGEVPADAAEVHLTSCVAAGGGSATYRAGDIG